MSYHVLIKTESEPGIIEAPVWLPTRQEAMDFGRLSIQVLSWYVVLTHWRVVECNEPANYLFDAGRLTKINKC